MFDIFSKLGEIKEKANQLKSKVENESFSASDSKNLVSIKTNGKKDITEILLNDTFQSISKIEQEQALKEAINSALNQSESFIINELKSIIPNIPGINIFG